MIENLIVFVLLSFFEVNHSDAYHVQVFLQALFQQVREGRISLALEKWVVGEVLQNDADVFELEGLVLGYNSCLLVLLGWRPLCVSRLIEVKCIEGWLSPEDIP